MSGSVCHCVMRGMDRTCLPDRLMLSHPRAPHVNHLPSLQLPNVSRLSFECLLWTQTCGFNQIELLVACTLEQDRPARHDPKATDEQQQEQQEQQWSPNPNTSLPPSPQSKKQRSKKIPPSCHPTGPKTSSSSPNQPTPPPRSSPVPS